MDFARKCLNVENIYKKNTSFTRIFNYKVGAIVLGNVPIYHREKYIGYRSIDRYTIVTSGGKIIIKNQNKTRNPCGSVHIIQGDTFNVHITKLIFIFLFLNLKYSHRRLNENRLVTWYVSNITRTPLSTGISVIACYIYDACYYRI